MRRKRSICLPVATLLVACASRPDQGTLAGLRDVEPDMTDTQVENSLDHAILGYRRFLEETPESALTPEAMRRLADLKLEKEYGILGGSQLVELPAPEAGAAAAPDRPRAEGIASHSESAADFERRATRGVESSTPATSTALEHPGAEQAAPSGPLEAIALYDRILADYPSYPSNDQVLYQKARALDELGRNDEAIEVMQRLIAEYPHSRHLDEVQFRRAEYFFVRRRYLDAEDAYGDVVRIGPASEYYELALYKLGWTFYKQELHEEAFEQYIAMLDYKVSTGYDFDQTQDEGSARRVADTFRVISLSLSNLGGPASVQAFFAANGGRSYEDRIYSHLGEFYFEKLRYHDAAASYQAFVALHPLHRVAPHFGMRVVEIYEAGGFPKLVLEAKKEFAASYGLDAEYWRHFDVAEAPEVLRYLKANLRDLASHYHARYQQADLADERSASLEEALRWYRAFLTSFPADVETPAIHYRLADLLLENDDFDAAAREYERTAYDYPAHERSAAAGYAAIYAHREHEKRAQGEQKTAARREAVASTLRFVDAFPEHEHAAAVLGAAVDDLYAMQDLAPAIATGRRLIERYPQAEVGIRRSAWAVIAHASFDQTDYPQAEQAYARVLEMTSADDPSRQAVVDNLAAAIYQQGEQAEQAGDHRGAADHFLRVAQAAPDSAIRAAAEYDAGAALIRVEDWDAAATVLDEFRQAHPEHELHREATKQMAHVYREQGNLPSAAAEYERVAAEAEDSELRREALLEAGDLYESADLQDRAMAVYLRYVEAFPKPIEPAAETHYKLAQGFAAAGDEGRRLEQLRRIVEIDAVAGGERTPRSRYLAAQSALVLAQQLHRHFAELELSQPFEVNLREKQRRMDAALEALGRLVDYEIGEVTAAATYAMAEVYLDFSRALLASERPADLAPAELQDYEMALEEEAFPFEGRAIEVHEKNLELVESGVYNRWIERSLARLAELVPGRYAKFEASSGPIASLDGYVYRVPDAPPASAPDAREGGIVATTDPATPPPASPAPDSAPSVDEREGRQDDADLR